MTKEGTCPLCKKSWDRCKCDLEKDFGLRVGSKEAARWERTLQSTEESIANSKIAIELNEYLKPFIQKRVDEEVKKFKSGK